MKWILDKPPWHACKVSAWRERRQAVIENYKSSPGPGSLAKLEKAMSREWDMWESETQ